MKKLLLLLIIPFLSFGQGWIQTYNESFTFPVHTNETSDGGYIIHAYLNEVDGYKIFKTNSFGDIQWTWTENAYTYLNFLKESEDDGFIYVADEFNYDDGANSRLIKINSSGIVEEVDLFSNENETYLLTSSVQSTTDNGFILLQFHWPYTDTFVGLYGGVVSKFDSLNNIQWQKNIIYPDPFNTSPVEMLPWLQSSPVYQSSEVLSWGKAKIIETSNQEYYIINSLTNYGEGEVDIEEFLFDGNPYIIKLNSNGEIIWEQNINDNFGNFHSFGGSLSNNGGSLIIGNTFYYPFDNTINTLNDEEYYGLLSRGTILNTDINGDTLWTRSIGIESDSIVYLETENPCYCHELYSSYLFDVKSTNDNGYVVVGYNLLGSGPHIIKLDNQGNITWSQNNYFNQGESALPISIHQTSDSGYIVTGILSSFDDLDGFTSLYYDFFLLKIDSVGNYSYLNTTKTFSDSKNALKSIDILGREANNNEGFQLQIYDDGSVEKKYFIK